MKYNRKKNEKREIDLVSLFLLIGIIVFYALLGVMMTFIIVTSHAPFALKIIGGSVWIAGYVAFGVAYYLADKTTRNILRLEYI